MLNWGMNQFVQYMMKKLLHFSGKLKGTKYEAKLKNSENQDFYDWILSYLKSHCEEQGWAYIPPEI